MTPERWQQIKQLFQQAREMAPGLRTAFLDQRCQGDPDLRSEVISLLEADQQPHQLIDRPAYEAAAKLIQTDDVSAANAFEGPQFVGQAIGTYEFISEIGRGGMGLVYLGRDTRLDRRVAIKMLPAGFATDPDRVRRFQQEARAASLLNHPNIVTILEVAESDGQRFIVSEFIEGKTLREIMKSGALKLLGALDVVIQTASALSAAHDAGIVHRDIKPENIMVRPDGYVKVLDFGLAKLTEQARVSPSGSGEEETRPLELTTRTGVVMGTVMYMSPEQARGQRVDGRTDIFSLGVVLYEAITGRAPFQGETPSHTIVAILESQPSPIGEYVPDAPPELQMIVDKALRKKSEQRHQTMREMLDDLREVREEAAFRARRERHSRHDSGAKASAPVEVDLRRPRERLDAEVELERLRAPAMGTPERRAISDAAPALKAESDRTANTGEVGGRSSSSAEYIISELKRHKTGAGIVLAGFAAVVLGGFLGLYKLVSQRPPNQAPTQTAAAGRNMKIARLTANGKTESAAISPDGKYVAYVVKDGTQQSLWMRLAATNSNVQIVPPSDLNYGAQTFSPDGTYVYYLVRDKDNPNGGLYQAPALGGTTRKILVNIASPITFSPDGSHFAFVRNDESSSGEYQLMIANAEGTGEWKLAARKTRAWFDYGGPAWSPDGKVIACGGGSYGEGYHDFVIAVEVENGRQKEFTAQSWSNVGRVAWLTDGSGLVVNAEDEGSLDQIWELAYPRGEVRKIVNDLTDYSGISLTADSKAFVTVQGDPTSNTWIAPSSDVNRAKQITYGKLEGSHFGLVWTPDARIVYKSLASGNPDIWIMNQDGTNQKQLTTDPSTDEQPSVSPDGRTIVFVSHRAGFPSLWRMDIDGGNLKQLSDKQEDYAPQISADGRWIVFDSWRSGKRAIWKMPVDGGAPVQLSDKFTRGPAISPDGKLIACFYKEEQPNSPWRIIVINFEGGAPIKTFDLPPTFDINSGLQWTPDGREITYVDTRGASNLWSQPYGGGAPKQLTDFKVNGVWQRAWSRDGRWLALARGTVTKDVVVIKDFN